MNAFEAYKAAYKKLAKAGHSGMSYGFAIHTLNRLLNDKPLTPIEDNTEEWEQVNSGKDGIQTFQSTRYYSFFKYIDEEGNISFTDQERVSVVDEDGSGWTSPGICKYIDKLEPIKMPYYPPDRKIKVYRVGEFDAPDPENPENILTYYKLTHYVLPNRESKKLNTYFADNKIITKKQYETAEKSIKKDK